MLLYMQKLLALSALLRFLQEFLASNPGAAFRVCGDMLCQLWHNNGIWVADIGRWFSWVEVSKTILNKSWLNHSFNSTLCQVSCRLNPLFGFGLSILARKDDVPFRLTDISWHFRAQGVGAWVALHLRRPPDSSAGEGLLVPCLRCILHVKTAQKGVLIMCIFLNYALSLWEFWWSSLRLQLAVRHRYSCYSACSFDTFDSFMFTVSFRIIFLVRYGHAFALVVSMIRVHLLLLVAGLVQDTAEEKLTYLNFRLTVFTPETGVWRIPEQTKDWNKQQTDRIVTTPLCKI